MRPKLLDLFCGAGGASMGYHRAGFEVEGVDINPQPHYLWKFYQADALEFPLKGYDAYHASPPCQRFSKSVSKINRLKHPDFIVPIRERLINTGLPYVIENVPGSPLLNPIVLCGSAFDLDVRRHRLFESNIKLISNGCFHKDYQPRFPCAWNRKTPLRFLSISGGWGTKGVSLETQLEAMGITWRMNYKEVSEAIPPAYTAYIGYYLMEAIGGIGIGRLH